MLAETLTQAQRNDLCVIAAMIIPASDEHKVPGADDAAIQADILATLGRDTEAVLSALGLGEAELAALRDARAI
jgi:crotonobetainyl-CoA:carnitine CoA-transferase CaiB-like acyl-CoA transferase